LKLSVQEVPMRQGVRFAAGLVFLAASAMASPAEAQGPGVRAGVSVDPDQFYVGGHYETSPLVDRLYFRPNVEVGFGDDLTTVAVNLEAVYKIPLKSNRPTSFYMGGGPAIVIYDRDGGTDTEGGLNLLAGLEFGKFFVEVKGGVFDSPDLKVGVGYTFR
jgi:hypothetical protein